MNNDVLFEEMSYPKDKTLVELFCEQVRKTPDNTALLYCQQKMSYRELNFRADILANDLRNAGAGRNMLIGILCEQSPELIVSMIAILKAGGAFFVIDPHYPKKRINVLLDDSKVTVLLTRSGYLEGVEFNNKIIILDIHNENQNDNYNENPNKDSMVLTNINEPCDLAFVVYTSGTTGIPKAAMIEHRNLINVLFYLRSRLSADTSTRVIQYFNPSFSVSYQEIFVTLMFGGTLYIIDENIKLNINNLLEFISKNEINTLFLPASILKLIINEEKYYSKLSATMNNIVTAGEQIIFSEKFMKHLEYTGIDCYNNYGTSETNMATILNIRQLEHMNQILPVGKPISNTYIYILDENHNILPMGTAGEIYISGDSVGRGYLNNDELTKEKFLQNPFIKGRIMYKTGDSGRRLPDGNIQLLGRMDFQVKIRGFRVELEEIEYNLLLHPLIKEAVVVAKQGIVEDNFLYAYILTDEPITSEEIKLYLSAKIPAHMMPSYIIRLEELPRTVNGKIDRKALIENRTVLINAQDMQSSDFNNSKMHMTIFNEIKAILQTIYKNEFINIGADDDFIKLGLDSISFLKLIAEIENRFDFIFDDDKNFMNDRLTVKELIACVEEKGSFSDCMEERGKYEA